MAATWAVLHTVGQIGFERLAQRMIDTKRRLLAGLGQLPDFEILGSPAMTLFAVGSSTVNVFALCEAMERRGWTMHPQYRLGDLPASFHINLIPIHDARIDQWLADLKEATAEVKTRPNSETLAPLRAALSAIDPAQIEDAMIGGMLEMAGLGGGELPGEQMTEVNELLNELPPALTDRLLTLYVNQLNRLQR